MRTENLQCYHCGNIMLIDRGLLEQPVTCLKCHQTIESNWDAGQIEDVHEDLSAAIRQASDERDSIFATTEPPLDALFGDEEAPQVQMPSAPKAPPFVDVAQSDSLLSIPLTSASADAVDGSPTTLSESPIEPPDEKPKETISPGIGDLLLLPAWENRSPDALVADQVKQSAGHSLSSGDIADVGLSSFPQGAPAEESPLPGFAEGLLSSASSDALAAPDFTIVQHGSGGEQVDLKTGERPDSGTSLRNREFLSSLPRRATPQGMRSGLFLAVVVIPLISYSILATIAIIILYLRPQQPSLEYLPDLDGDLKGTKSQKKASVSYERLSPDSPLPEKLWVSLGGTLRLGDVEVKPKKVELRPIQIRRAGAEGEIETEEKSSFVLHIECKNVSEDLVFSPSDPFFDRAWKSSQPLKPYNFLDVGSKRIYGGAIPWRPGRELEGRELVVGQTYRYLEPGQSLSTVVCTDPAEDSTGLLDNHKGLIRWRVQFRRGLVSVGGRNISTTGVVGVKFSKEEIDLPKS